MDKEVLFKMNEQVAGFYQEQLSKSEQAQNYLKQRNINDESIKDFKIGFAGANNELYKYLIGQGYTAKQIESANLCIKNDNGEYVDKYTNRIIFPVINREDKIVAFGGRAIDDTKPKYINTAETDIYSKRENLYGINTAKNYCKEELILVEGYVDVISLHQRGIKNVVALLGTAISEEQVQLIKQYTNNVVVVLDSDIAGNIARLRVIEMTGLYNINCRIAQTEGTKDSDEYINKYGVEEFKSLINNSISSIEFKQSIYKK